MISVVNIFLITFANACVAFANERPNIVFILADDLGWNDVGFHGSGRIPTPNIDALAYDGVILNRYYVTPICTPSRSALMTGKYPIHTGMQHGVLKNAEPWGLPLTEKLLPEYLKELGYSNHIVGKWHLGHYKREYTPTFRGFDSHLGFWGGRIDYFDHTSEEYKQWGLDMRRGLDPAWDLHGQYTTDIFTRESVKIIKNHDTSKPLFLYLAHGATHSANPYDPLQINVTDYPDLTSFGPSYNRSRFAGMVHKLDQSVGEVFKALYETNMLSNTIIVFSSDNGGPAAGFNFNFASNWPLRGVKNTNYEGGTRGVGVIWSMKLTDRGRVDNDTYIHITDWLPTLLTAAGGDSSSLKNIDGIDLWRRLKENDSSLRNRLNILHNIDDIFRTSAITSVPWKLMQGSTYGTEWNSWYGPSEREAYYNITKVRNSEVGKVLAKLGKELNDEHILSLRNNSMIVCPAKNTSLPSCMPEKSPCLVNIVLDPCEYNNYAYERPDIMKMMMEKLQIYNQTAIPPGNKPLDQRANPDKWNHVWTNFGDYI